MSAGSALSRGNAINGCFFGQPPPSANLFHSLPRILRPSCFLWALAHPHSWVSSSLGRRPQGLAMGSEASQAPCPWLGITFAHRCHVRWVLSQHVPGSQPMQGRGQHLSPSHSPSRWVLGAQAELGVQCHISSLAQTVGRITETDLARLPLVSPQLPSLEPSDLAGGFRPPYTANLGTSTNLNVNTIFTGAL